MPITDLRQGTPNSPNVSTPGSGASAAANAWIVEELPLTMANIMAKAVDLNKVPSTPSRVKLGVIDGPGEFDYEVDYEMLGGSASQYSDIFNASVNASGQLIANEAVAGFQSYSQVALLDSPGDSVFFSFTPNTNLWWGFMAYAFVDIPAWTLPKNGPNDGMRIARTASNESLAFQVYQSIDVGGPSTDWRSTGMTPWAPVTITGGTCSLVIGASNKLELYYNGTFIGESLNQVPVNGWKIYLALGNSLLFPDISAGASNTMSWDGLTLDGLLEVNDTLKVTYTTRNP